MNSMFSRSRFLAAALALGALAGCNAVEDVRSEPFIELPSATVVLKGTVTGLGSRRQLGLINNGDVADGLGVIGPVPLPTTVGNLPVGFTFGARAVRDANGNPVPYNIQITDQPYGKTCSFRAGSQHSGILSTQSPPDILIDCVPSGVTLYDMTVNLNPAFANAPGATVRLTTEDGVFVKVVDAADRAAGTVTFAKKLFNAGGPGAPVPSPVFTWTVSASTTVGGVTTKCPITNPSNSPATANPTGNISTPIVGACTFTISGAAHYSRPAGVVADPPLGAGLTLELRNMKGVKMGTATVPAGSFPAGGIPFTFNNLDTPTPTTAFTSNPDADFQVVVTNHPAGQTCIVPDGGYVSLQSLVLGNPTNVTAVGLVAAGTVPTAGAATATNAPVAGTRLILACRNRPALADTLNGVYRLTSTTVTILTTTNTPSATPAVTQSTSVVTSKWLPFDLTVQNNASSNIMTFFDDGTFTYGLHHSVASVEHGFYEYSATLRADNTIAPPSTTPAGRLRFTIHTDTHFNTVFRTAFNINDNTGFGGTNNDNTDSPGVSALPGALTYTTAPNAPAPFRHSNMGAVVKTAASGATPAKITGTAGPYGGNAATNSTAAFTFSGPIGFPATPAPPTGTATSTTASIVSQVSLEFTEVPQITGQMTGGWISQDHRRSYAWDKFTTYGFQVGVNGLVNLTSACFVTEDLEGPSGIFQRRDARSRCVPINRPRTLPTEQVYTSAVESQDDGWLLTTHASSTTVGAPAAAVGPPSANVVPGLMQTGGLNTRFPNYEYRLPGGNSVLDGRYSSPVYYHVAPAATFFATADAARFGGDGTSRFPAGTFPAPAAAFTTWCTSEILGIRATQNGVPFREPVYLCRQRAQ
ncbi:MAG: hypothetical protein ABIQ86_00540 [Steroidobacteraceae bacterium]